MKRSSLIIRTILASMAVAAGALPSQAHGIASGGGLAGLAHPLLGLDHLFLLIAVGAAAALLSPRLLLWALGGALMGALWGGTSWSGPLAESLAALAVVAVALLPLALERSGPTQPAASAAHRLAGVVVAAGLAIHSHLHGLEAPADGSSLLWWSGALLSSAVVCGGTTALLRRLSPRWGRTVALAMLVGGAGWALS